MLRNGFTCVSRKRHRRCYGFQCLETRLLLAADPVITEWMARNQQSLDDGNGRSSDWIEVFNAGDEAADLTDWFLTDDLETLDRWRFPSVQIEPKEYLIVFASANDMIDQNGFIHANFKLSSKGEVLALVRRDGTIVQQVEFPRQFADVSYGLEMPDLDQVGFFSEPTPGAANAIAYTGVTESRVVASAESGAFADSVRVELSSSSETGVILYTLDGSMPNAESAKYNGAIEIRQSRQIRARVLEAGRVLGPTTTKSFVKMDAEVAAYSSDLPVMVIDNFGAGDLPNTGWNQTNAGIRQLPRQAANLMLFEMDDANVMLESNADLSSRIGIRVRGAFSSSFAEPGLSFEAWSDGANVDVDISPLGIAADSDWVLYAPNPQYDETLIDNSFLFEISNQMGQWAPDIRYVETFVNTDGGELTMDDHVGLYVITEKVKRTKDRIDFKEFSSDASSGGWLLDINRLDPIALDGTRPRNFHTSGPDGESQTRRDLSSGSSRGDDIPRQQNAYINYDDPSGLAINPSQRDSIAAWFDEMEAVLFGRADGVTWNDPVHGYPKYIDVDNFIDYFILNDISHNGDGLLISMWVYNPDPNGDGKLRFGPIWDADLGSYTGTPSVELMRRTDRLWYGRMFEDPSFVMQYTERWQDLRRTVLSDANMATVIDQFYHEIGDQAAVRDSVRNWSVRLSRMQKWLSERAAAIDQLFVSAPILNQQGGQVPAGFELKMRSEQGTVYYTFDGTDPRHANGNVVANARAIQTELVSLVSASALAHSLVPDVAFDEAIGAGWVSPDFVEGGAGENWIVGPTGIGFDERGTYDEMIGTDLGVFRNPSVYVRIPFEVSADQLARVEGLMLQMQYDDGFVAYLNGGEVARSNVPGVVGQPVPIDVRAERSHRARSNQFESFAIDNAALRVGTNYLVLQGLNRSRTGGDLLIRPVLDGVAVVSPPIVINAPTTVIARTRHEGEWSGRVVAEFEVPPTISDDLNGDGQITAADIDLFCAAIHDGDQRFDFTGDGELEFYDLEFYVRQRLGTNFGDANLDGLFDSSDLVAVFQAGLYEDDLPGNAGWATGDWNCDGEFDSSDLVVAFLQAGFVAPNGVPVEFTR